jgi:hypothetical protein
VEGEMMKLGIANEGGNEDGEMITLGIAEGGIEEFDGVA